MNLETKVEQAERCAQQAEVKAQKAEADGHYALNAPDAQRAKKSWGLTAPLHWIYGQASRLKQEGFKGRVDDLIKKVFQKINHELLLRTALRQKLIGVCRRIGIHATLKNILQKAKVQKIIYAHSDELSPRARQIYTQLLVTRVSHKNKGAH